jgi:hypothetical protein
MMPTVDHLAILAARQGRYAFGVRPMFPVVVGGIIVPTSVAPPGGGSHTTTASDIFEITPELARWPLLCIDQHPATIEVVPPLSTCHSSSTADGGGSDGGGGSGGSGGSGGGESAADPCALPSSSAIVQLTYDRGQHVPRVLTDLVSLYFLPTRALESIVDSDTYVSTITQQVRVDGGRVIRAVDASGVDVTARFGYQSNAGAVRVSVQFDDLARKIGGATPGHYILLAGLTRKIEDRILPFVLGGACGDPGLRALSFLPQGVPVEIRGSPASIAVRTIVDVGVGDTFRVVVYAFSAGGFALDDVSIRVADAPEGVVFDRMTAVTQGVKRDSSATAFSRSTGIDKVAEALFSSRQSEFIHSSDSTPRLGSFDPTAVFTVRFADAVNGTYPITFSADARSMTLPTRSPVINSSAATATVSAAAGDLLGSAIVDPTVRVSFNVINRVPEVNLETDVIADGVEPLQPLFGK